MSHVTKLFLDCLMPLLALRGTFSVRRVFSLPVFQKIFSSTAAMGIPHRTSPKVMRTMTTSAAALTSPRCPTTINTIYNAPISLKESAAAKPGICCNANSSSTSPQGLQEIPTRIPSKTPTAAIVSPHADDDDRTPPQPHPDLSSTVEERNSIPLLSLPSAVDESFDYQSELV